MPFMNPTDPKTKYFVAAKVAKTGMYECSVHHDHVTYKINAFVTNAIACANTAFALLKEQTC